MFSSFWVLDFLYFWQPCPISPNMNKPLTVGRASELDQLFHLDLWWGAVSFDLNQYEIRTAHAHNIPTTKRSSTPGAAITTLFQ
jgi:hypothetical protein